MARVPEALQSASGSGRRVVMLVFNTLNPDPRVWREARTLSYHGYDVQILAMRQKGQKVEEAINGFSVFRNLPSSPYKVFPFWYKILSFILDSKRRSFDFCHCHDAETLLVGHWLAIRDRAKLIYDAHEYFPDFMPIQWMRVDTRMRKCFHHRYVRLRNEGRLISRADAVITVNESIASLLQKNYRLERKPTYLLNTLPYQKVQRSAMLSEMFRLPPDRMILLFQGTVSEDRQVERVIQLLEGMDERVVFVMLGRISQVYQDSLSRLARDLKVGDRVFFGEVPHNLLLNATASANIGMYIMEAKTLSYKLSLPNKFFEYLMAELPVIVGQLPEMEKIVERYRCGFVVNPTDLETMRQLIQRLMVDRALYAEIKANVMLAKKELCWEIEEEKLLRLYRQLG